MRGAICEEFLAERYPTIRWNFEWENYVIVGVPDGITEDFVYEFKTTGSEFLLSYMERSALVQGDLYGFFFRRQNKRVQIYVVSQAETYTWHEKVDTNAAISLLKTLRDLMKLGNLLFLKSGNAETVVSDGYVSKIQMRDNEEVNVGKFFDVFR